MDDSDRDQFPLVVRTELRRGGPYAEALAAIEQFWADTTGDTELGASQRKVVESELAAVLEEQRAWPTPTRTEQFLAAYALLEERGVLALVDFACCGTCAGAEGWDLAKARGARGFLYFHRQDVERAIEGGPIFLGFDSTVEPDPSGAEPMESVQRRADDASVAIAREARALLESAGFGVEWDGTVATRLAVDVGWQVRLQGLAHPR